MKKVLYVIGILVVLMVGAVFALPSVIDWNDYKDEMTAWSERSLGRRIEIAGDIRVAVLPTPALMAENVRLANVEGATDADMATLDLVEVRVAFMPLLAGLVQVETVRLVRPTVHLERFADGTTNLEFLAASAGAAKPASAGDDSASGAGRSERAADPTFRLDHFAVVDGVLVYRDAGSSRVERFESINATFAAASLNGPYESFGEFAYSGIPVGYRLGVGKMVQGRTLPFDLRVDSVPGAAKAEIAGAIVGLQGAPKFKGDIVVSGDSLATLVTALTGAGNLPGLAEQPFTVEAMVALDATALEAKDLEVSLGAMKTGGTVTAEYGGPMSITGQFSSPHIDLDSLLALQSSTQGSEEEVDGVSGDSAPVPRKQAAAKKESSEHIQVPFVLPEGLTVELQLRADKITYRKSSISDARLNLDLSGGEIVISQLDALLPGGSDVFASGFLTTPEGKPTLDLSVETKISDLHRVFSWLGIPVPDVPAGRLRKAEFAGEIRATPEEVQVRKINLAFDSTRMTGGVTVALGRRRAAFGASFKLDRLNLDAYLDSRNAPTNGAGNGSKPADSKAGVDKPVTPSKPPFADALGALGSFDANLVLTVGELTVERNLVRDARLDAMLYQGRLDVRNASVADVVGTSAAIKGGIANLGALPSFDDVVLSAKIADVTRLSRAFGIDLGSRGKEAISMAVDGRIHGSILKPRTKASVTALGGTVEAEGDAYPLPGETWFQGQVKTAFPDLRQLLSRLGADYRPNRDVGGFDLSASVTAGPKLVSISDLNGKIGKADVTGAVSWDTSQSRARLSADLTTGVLAIDSYLPQKRSAAYLDREPDARVIPANFTVAPGSNPWAGLLRTIALAEGIDTSRWSTHAIDFEALRVFDGEARIRSAAVTHEAYRLDNADIVLGLQSGVARLAHVKGQLFGGEVNGNATIDTTANRVEGSMNITGADLARAAKAHGETGVNAGRLDFVVDFAASGASEAELVSALSGKGAVKIEGVSTQGEVRTPSLAVIAWIPHVFDQVRGAVGMAAGTTDATASFTVKAGRVACPDLRIVSKMGTATAEGVADLPRWQMDFQGDVTLSQNILSSLLSGATGAELIIPLKVSGPLDKPNPVLDLKRLPGNVLRLPGKILKNPGDLLKKFIK